MKESRNTYCYGILGTHERNGIHGEMFFAAIIAAAFRETDIARLIEIGLAHIPAECRLARWVRRYVSWFFEYATWEGAIRRLEDELNNMHAVHTINNALVVLIALHYGRGRLDKTVCIAVMCALDTDCNAATAGSIVGAMLGHAALDSSLAPRLNDPAQLGMIGFQDVTFTDLAARHAAVWKKLRAASPARP